MPDGEGSRRPKTPATSRPVDFDAMAKLLPTRAGDWVQRGADRRCDRRTIYGYMDGAAEVYLTYAFAGLILRRYRPSRGPSIVVELFDMTTSFDAYGVFSNGRDEELPDAKIGQGAECRSGLLTFWRNHYFVAVRVDADDVPPSAAEAMTKLGRTIAESIGKDGPLPPVLGFLPPEGRIAHAERYTYRPEGLSYHYDLGDRNVLHLTPKTQAVLAGYRRDRVRCGLLCVLYPTAALAAKGRSGLVAEIARGADAAGAAKTEDGRWLAVATHDRLLAAALEAPTRAAALELANQTIQRYRASRKKPPNQEPRS